MEVRAFLIGNLFEQTYVNSNSFSVMTNNGCPCMRNRLLMGTESHRKEKNVPINDTPHEPVLHALLSLEQVVECRAAAV